MVQWKAYPKLEGACGCDTYVDGFAVSVLPGANGRGPSGSNQRITGVGTQCAYHGAC